jgi:hypothetical protein
VSFDGGDSIDTVDFINQGTTGRTVDLDGSKVVGMLGSELKYSAVETVYARGTDTASGHDQYRVVSTPAAPTGVESAHAR